MVWKQFSHANLVPFLGINEALFNLALVSEWMEHGTILDFVKSTPETNRLKLVCVPSYQKTIVNLFDT